MAGCRSGEELARSALRLRARVLDALQALGVPVVPSEANFLWLDLPDVATDLCSYGERRGVVLRSFAGVGIRVTIGTPAENDRMVELLAAARDEGVWAQEAGALS